MATDLGKKIKNKLWETPQVIKDIGRAGKMAGTALGVAGSAVYDPASIATEYFTGIKTPRVMDENIKAFKSAWGIDSKKKKPKKIPAPVAKSKSATPKIPVPGVTSTPGEILSTEVPLYTNIPKRLSEPGAIPVSGGGDIQYGSTTNDRFSNVGSFSFTKPEEEKYIPLSLDDATEKGKAFGLTGEQYNALQSSTFAKRKREERAGARDIELEREKGRQARENLVPKQPEFKTGTYEEGFERPYVVGPKGGVTFPTPTSESAKGTSITESEFGKLKILSPEKVKNLSPDKQKPYFDWLQKEHPQDFLNLAKFLKGEVSEL